MDTRERRKSVRSFLQATLTAEPSAADYEAAGLGGELERAARRWVAHVRKTFQPAPGARRGDAAAGAVDEATDALVAALPDEWSPTAEDPAELANEVRRD